MGIRPRREDAIGTRAKRISDRLVEEGKRFLKIFDPNKQTPDEVAETAEEITSWVNDIESFVNSLYFCMDCDLVTTPIDGKCRTCGGTNLVE